ncbi:MAG: hypothetical protein KKA64_01185 [Nanoarchaeota archaeon]|nr:hypothetical protein [Nanoarchaeota archaeon]
METKNLLVFFSTIAIALCLVATVSASLNIENVTIRDGTTITAGDTIRVEVTLSGTASDVIDVNVEIKGYGNDIEDEKTIGPFFSDENETIFTKVVFFSLNVPYDADDLDELYKNAKLVVYASSDGEEDAGFEDTPIRIQRDAYTVQVMSIDASQTVEAGQSVPVDVVLKNKGSQHLDDLYVTAKITALNAEKKSYFGDLVAIEGIEGADDEDEDTVSGRIFLQIPDNAKAGTYTLEVSVSGEDVTASDTAQIQVKNEFFGNNVIASVSGKTVAVGQDAEYSILIVNPTNKLKVYNIIPETATGLSVSAGENVVAIPAGSSKTVKITANAATEGTYNFNVNVLSGEDAVGKVALSAKVEGKTSTASPMVILTVVLAIVFIVLLVVLVVLLGKKPEKTEEFGESYY